MPATILTKREQDYLLNVIGIPPRYLDVTFAEYDNDLNAKDTLITALSEAKTLMHNGLGFNLFGPNGVGKTHLMMASIKHCVLSHKIPARVIQFSDMVDLYAAAWSDPEAETRMKELFVTPILAIEELGKEFMSAKPGSDQSNLPKVVLDKVLRFRVQSQKPVWITSNCQPGAIKDIYTKDIASLLKQCTIPLIVTGRDRRDDELKRNKTKFLG